MNPRYAVLAGLLLALTACGPTEPSGEKMILNDNPTADAPAVAAKGTVKSVDGVAIHYDDQGSGPATLIFVHGWSCDRSYWEAQRDHFAESYRVITVDLAGHGESGDEREDFTMQSFGADVAGVAEALDLSNVVLVGHSMGGPVAVEAGRLLQGRVAGVVGVDTLRSVALQRTAAEVDARIAILDEDFVGNVKAFVGTMFLENSDPELRDWVIEDMAAAPPRVAKSAMRGLGVYNPSESIAALDVPFVLINSSYQPTDQDAFRALTDSFNYIEMSGVGHFVMMDDPATFNTHLRSVIESL